MFIRILSLIISVVVSSTVIGQVGPIIGDTYFIAPGGGTESGFQLAGGPFENSTINSDGELIGPDLGGGMVLSTDTLIQNSATNFDLIFRIETIGGNLMPEGIIGDSGGELTTLGIFVGGGIDPVDLATPVIAESAQIEAFNLAGESIGTIPVLDFANFQTGIGGGWDGSFGLNFGNQIPIGDVGAVELQINFNTIPEPTTFGIFAAVGIASIARRRRN